MPGTWTDTIDRRHSFRGRLIDPDRRIRIQGRNETLEIAFLDEPFTGTDPLEVTLGIEALDALATAHLCTAARPYVASEHVRAGIDTFAGTVSILAPDGTSIVLTTLDSTHSDYVAPTTILALLAECATRINDKPPT